MLPKCAVPKIKEWLPSQTELCISGDKPNRVKSGTKVANPEHASPCKNTAKPEKAKSDISMDGSEQVALKIEKKRPS